MEQSEQIKRKIIAPRIAPRHKKKELSGIFLKAQNL